MKKLPWRKEESGLKTNIYEIIGEAMPLGKELRHGLVLGKLQLNGSSTKRDLGQQGHYHSRKAFIDCGDQIQ